MNRMVNPGLANCLLYLTFCLIAIGCSNELSKFNAPYLIDYSVQRNVRASHAGVSTAHPLATRVGTYLLQRGGNAVDAAIGIQLALAVVYPQAGNIGGGGFMVIHLANGKNMALDFREKAPLSASKNMYLDSSGNPVISKSLRGHLASGVPGTIDGIFKSLQYAKLPFKELIQPAIDLADQGFVLTREISELTGWADQESIATAEYNTMPNAFDENHQWKLGDTVKQPDLARTLKRIRDKGRSDFYEGETARLIVQEMKRGGGNITMQDLKSYQAKWREPHLFNYRGYDIISMPLPSSGGILLHQMLKMVEPYPVSSYGYGSGKAISLMVEAERRAYKDRAEFMGDNDFVNVDVLRLTSEPYLTGKMADYNPGEAGRSLPIGEYQLQKESKETTHFSVIDSEGNAVSVTTTLNMPYGCQVVVGGAGFFLNNEMNDFSLKPGVSNASGGIGGIENSIEPNKRMLSSMTPTIVLKDGKLFMVVGSPGGTTIPTSVFQMIVDVIDFKMFGFEAVNKPRFHHEWLPDYIQMEPGFLAGTVDSLKRMGYNISKSEYLGRVELIRVLNNGNLEIVSDFRGVTDCAAGY